MNHLLSKFAADRRWLGISSLLALLLASGCASLPSKHVYTEIEIEAPASRVWTILADNESYPDWNPYHVSVRGKLEAGSKLQVVLHKPNGERVEIEPRVMRVVPMRELTWGGGVRGIFHGEHVFLLEEIDAGNTRLVHREDFVGIAVPFASLDAIEDGYRQMNRALKIRAEMQ
jgi:hypothetical protein